MTIIIAEAGENHCGDLSMALRLIEMAAESGTDYVKFQLYDAAKSAKDDPEREWFEKVQVSDADFLALVTHAQAYGIRPLFTPWDVTKAKLVFDAGINEMKISSFHTTDAELLTYINTRATTVFLATGMSSLEEIDRAVQLLSRVTNLYLLHCVSEYPLPAEHVNLRVMDALQGQFGNRAKIGYSDHTIGILAPVAAAARGAEVIEKHITLDKNLPGTDHVLSADPAELADMVKQVRAVEVMLGQELKALTELEGLNQSFMRERFRH